MPDAEMQARLPDHLTPYGRLIKGNADPRVIQGIMVSYCPFCGSRNNSGWSFALLDPKNPYHAATSCCHQDLYEKPEQAPPD